MSEVKHTPGPWVASKAMSPDNTGGYDYAISVDDAIIAEVFQHTGWEDKATGKYAAQPVRANADLIAAAPDLYAAAKELMNFLATYPHQFNVDISGYEQDMLDALAKAEGK